MFIENSMKRTLAYGVKTASNTSQMKQLIWTYCYMKELHKTWIHIQQDNEAIILLKEWFAFLQDFDFLNVKKKN